jgi:hypothetical protein
MNNSANQLLNRLRTKSGKGDIYTSGESARSNASAGGAALSTHPEASVSSVGMSPSKPAASAPAGEGGCPFKPAASSVNGDMISVAGDAANATSPTSKHHKDAFYGTLLEECERIEHGMKDAEAEVLRKEDETFLMQRNELELSRLKANQVGLLLLALCSLFDIYIFAGEASLEWHGEIAAT